jgi:predicted MFS family arabinose efflux permease
VPVGLVLVSIAPRYLPETERRPGHFDLAGAASSTLGMTALVYGFVRAASNGWGDPVTVASFAASVTLLATFVVIERRAEQPITPLRLFASRERSGAYAARILVVGAMFSMFFFLTQFLQGARGFSALHAGIAFLPMTLVMFGMVRLVPRLVERFGNTPLLVGGLVIALGGMAWMSQISLGAAYVPQIAAPLVLLGIGMGMAFTPLTTAGIAGVAPADAGAASGVVNAAHQLGGSLGLSVLVTVFASASRAAIAHAPAALTSAGDARYALAHGVAAAITGSVVLLSAALLIVAVTALPSRIRSAFAPAGLSPS